MAGLLHEVRADGKVARFATKQEAIDAYDTAIHYRLSNPIRRLTNGTVQEQYAPQQNIDELEKLAADLYGLLNEMHGSWQARQGEMWERLVELVPEVQRKQEQA